MQSPEEILDADARLSPFAGKRVWQAIILGVSVTVLALCNAHITAFATTSETGIRTTLTDFRVFWAAARLALEGDPLAVFDMARLTAEHNVDVGSWMPWLYPPGYLILILPLGAMSFAVAFFLWNLISIGLMAWAVRPFAIGSRALWLAVVLAPASMPAFILGQNSVIWLAVFLAALAALRGERWILAGVFIGCLTLKPQLGLMIPFALLAAGLWRTIFAASATAFLLAALPTLVLGPRYWSLFANRLVEMSDMILISINNVFLMVGPLRFFTRLGFSPEVALWAQWVVTALSAAMVFLLWRSARAGFDAKAAGLLIAMLLSAPYLWYYEAAFMAVIGLFLLRAGVLGRSPLHLVLLVLLWSGAVLLTVTFPESLAAERFLGAEIITPVLFTSLALLLHHVYAAKGGRPAQPAAQ